jgi:hypothetical protein
LRFLLGGSVRQGIDIDVLSFERWLMRRCYNDFHALNPDFGWAAERAIHLPVSLGSAVVHSGDIVLGDSDGVVIVRQEQLSAVSAAIPAILERERQNAAAIAGAAMPDWLARFVAETEIIDDGAD